MIALAVGWRDGSIGGSEWDHEYFSPRLTPSRPPPPFFWPRSAVPPLLTC